MATFQPRHRERAKGEVTTAHKKRPTRERTLHTPSPVRPAEQPPSDGRPAACYIAEAGCAAASGGAEGNADWPVIVAIIIITVIRCTHTSASAIPSGTSVCNAFVAACETSVNTAAVAAADCTANATYSTTPARPAATSNITTTCCSSATGVRRPYDEFIQSTDTVDAVNVDNAAACSFNSTSALVVTTTTDDNTAAHRAALCA